MSRASVVSGLRRRAAEDVRALRRELIQLADQNLNENARLHAEARIRAEIFGKYDVFSQAAAREVQADRESVIAHRGPARRLAGAFGNPERADAIARVAERCTPDALLRMARLAVESDDEAAAFGVFVAAAARLPDEPEVAPVLDVMSKPTPEEARYVADLLVAQHEEAMLASELVQATSASERLDEHLRARILEAQHIAFAPGDVQEFNEGDVNAAREALGVPWTPSVFELAPEPPKER